LGFRCAPLHGRDGADGVMELGVEDGGVME